MMAITTVNLQFNFLCGLRDYHIYRCIWNPVLNEMFPVRHEAGNPHDRFAIAGYKQFGSVERIVGHLPREIT